MKPWQIRALPFVSGITAAIVVFLILFVSLPVRQHRPEVFVGAPLFDSTAFAATQSTNFKWEVGIGGQVITNPTSATFLTVPAGATHAWITVKTNPVCISYGTAAPSATSGGEWLPGIYRVENDRPMLQALRVINCAEGATTVKVYYSRDRRVGD